jgi:exosome complex RNA-binding protein Rrp42 (RNase PH superfamily)
MLVDPTGDEEALMHALVTVACDDKGQLLALHKPGGPACTSVKTLLHCVAAATLRRVDVARALEGAGVRFGESVPMVL